MSATRRFAQLICESPREHDNAAIAAARQALIDTLACMFAGANEPVTTRSLAALSSWGPGPAMVFGTGVKLNPAFAALVNGASAHAFDFDDCDEPGNSHPSAVIFPALLGLAAEQPVSGQALLDAYIVGLEILQRLGEAMNMDHYRRGWLSTLTLGSIAAAGACARLRRLDSEQSVAALSLATSTASGLTNQGGYLAKQMNPGFAARNGVMAAALAASGIDASAETIDGPVSIGKCMGEYDASRFSAALAKLGNPWSILEHGLITKPYPSCGYNLRVIDAAIELHQKLGGATASIISIDVSVPDYYLDLLIYSRPENSAEAMFSAEYSAAVALVRGGFDLDSLDAETLQDGEISRLTRCARVEPRVAPDADRVYDPDDPDWVRIHLDDGRQLIHEIGIPTGYPGKPLTESGLRAKFDQCVTRGNPRLDRERLWSCLMQIQDAPELNPLWQACG